MVTQLISKLRTKEDLELLRGELDLLKNSLYQKDNNYKEVLENDIRGWVSEIISIEAKDMEIGKYLDDMEMLLKSVQILSASLAFEPSDSFVDRFSQFIKKNVSPGIVVDFLFNPQLIGGTQLSFKGKYVDLSLRKKIIQEFDVASFSVKQSPKVGINTQIN